ncbi:MAG TPA: hypothetical protein VFJ24_12125 [Gaiellales bacterium]|nr:hypothetical protein [Gaiellales bacterium]
MEVLLLCAAACLSGASGAAAQRRFEPDLNKLALGNGLQVFNRSVTALNDSARKGLHLSEGPGEGVAYVPGIELTNGVIEFDVRGKDLLQRSFVGVAFHGVDGTVFEAVYFRPFNFRSADATRSSHAVQYVASPAHPWDQLRAAHPGVYEQPVHPVPDPNGWFHVRVVVAPASVRVFVGDATEPSLAVSPLGERRQGLVGLWVGNNSGGDFAHLTIQPQ